MTRCLSKYALVFALIVINITSDVTYGLEWPLQSNTIKENWQGKWFPQPPDKSVDDNPTVEYGANHGHSDDNHGVAMGIPTKHCDDGKTNITLDWDNSPINYTCFENKYEYLPNIDVQPLIHGDHIPKQYSAPHKCMDTPISYGDTIPTFGAHRPLWPRYGEYIFLPKQRWIHNLEHGAVVMLYHPCANKKEVQLLRKLVTGCLYRHIITPYNLLDPERPLALVTWGYRFQMSKVDPDLVVKFIRGTALQGPEKKSDDGQFDYALFRPAWVVSDHNDNDLCPAM